MTLYVIGDADVEGDDVAGDDVDEYPSAPARTGGAAAAAAEVGFAPNAPPPVDTKMWGNSVSISGATLLSKGIFGFQTEQLVTVPYTQGLAVQSWALHFLLHIEGVLTTPALVSAQFQINVGVGRSVFKRLLNLNFDSTAATVTDDFRNVVASYTDLYKFLEMPASTINASCTATLVLGTVNNIVVAAYAAPIVMPPGSTK